MLNEYFVVIKKGQQEIMKRIIKANGKKNCKKRKEKKSQTHMGDGPTL